MSKCVFLAVGSAILWMSACELDSSQAKLRRSLTSAFASAAATNGCVLDLSLLTPFKWDRVFFLHPYMTEEAVDAELGFRWRSHLKSDLTYSDAFELIVFVKGQEVVAAANVARSIGDWDLRAVRMVLSHQKRCSRLNEERIVEGWYFVSTTRASRLSTDRVEIAEFCIASEAPDRA